MKTKKLVFNKRKTAKLDLQVISKEELRSILGGNTAQDIGHQVQGLWNGFKHEPWLIETFIAFGIVVVGAALIGKENLLHGAGVFKEGIQGLLRKNNRVKAPNDPLLEGPAANRIEPPIIKPPVDMSKHTIEQGEKVQISLPMHNASVPEPNVNRLIKNVKTKKISKVSPPFPKNIRNDDIEGNELIRYNTHEYSVKTYPVKGVVALTAGAKKAFYLNGEKVFDHSRHDRDLKQELGSGEEGTTFFYQEDERFIVKVINPNGEVREAIKGMSQALLSNEGLNELYYKVHNYKGELGALDIKQHLCVHLVISEEKSVYFNPSEDTKKAKKSNLLEVERLLYNNDYKHCAEVLLGRKDIGYMEFTLVMMNKFRDLGQAANIMNRMGYAHCDVKKTNIVYDVRKEGEGVFQLIDFGTAQSRVNLSNPLVKESDTDDLSTLSSGLATAISASVKKANLTQSEIENLDHIIKISKQEIKNTIKFRI